MTTSASKSSDSRVTDPTAAQRFSGRDFAPELGAWRIRAEFWIEGVGDAYGQDTNDAGTYLRLASDQVRFYRTGAAPHTPDAGGGGYRVRAFGPGADDVNEPLRMDEVPT